MKWKSIVSLSLFFYLIGSPNASYASSSFGPDFLYLKKNHIYKDKTMIDHFSKKEPYSKFVSIPAKCGLIIGAIPGWIFGGTITGGTIGLFSAPLVAANEREHKIMVFIMWPIYCGAIGADLFGRPTSFLGEIIIGTSFYITQLVFYDLPKKHLNKDVKK